MTCADDTARSAEGGRTVLLVTNRRLDENSGRAEKFATRARLLRQRGWTLEVGYVDPSPTGVAIGIPRCVRLARGADVVNSVCNPPHLHVVGAVTSRITDTPWLAEFRDPLVLNPDVSGDSVAAMVRRRIERYVLTHADRVAWYDGIQIPDDYFATQYPDVPHDRVQQLPPIGFELGKFERIAPVEFEQFTVTYAGSFYEGWIEPYTYLEGLGAYVDAHPETDPETDLQSLFYGDWNDAYANAAAEQGVTNYVEPRPFVSHDEIIGVLKGSDALLYVGGDDPRNRLNLPSKLYDYIGAGRPIIAIVDRSFRVADVVQDNGLGIVVEPGNPAGVRAALERLQSGSFECAPDPDVIAGFTREQSNEAYVAALESIVSSE